MAKTLSDYIEQYSKKQPFDFTNNPNQINRVDPSSPQSIEQNRGTSDISLHWPLLKFLAGLPHIRNIVEFGCRNGESTSAFLAGGVHSLISVDIDPTPLTQDLQDLENWKFVLQSSINRDLDIGWPDLLFIDSDHSYEHVLKEVKMHAHKVKHLLVFHDSVSCPGVAKAIDEFLEENEKEWSMTYFLPFNNGLTILKRVS